MSVAPEKFYRQTSFKLPIYHNKIVFVDTNDPDELMRKHPIEIDVVPYAHAYEVITSARIRHRYYMIILNTKAEFGNIDAGTLAHECFHITCFVLESKGVFADHVNCEAQAYLLEYIVNKATEFYFKKQ